MVRIIRPEAVTVVRRIGVATGIEVGTATKDAAKTMAQVRKVKIVFTKLFKIRSDGPAAVAGCSARSGGIERRQCC